MLTSSLKKYYIKFFLYKLIFTFVYKMNENKITKETDLVRLDKTLVGRIRAHKDVSGVPMATFLEKLAERELAILYPDGVIKK